MIMGQKRWRLLLFLLRNRWPLSIRLSIPLTTINFCRNIERNKNIANQTKIFGYTSAPRRGSGGSSHPGWLSFFYCVLAFFVVIPFLSFDYSVVFIGSGCGQDVTSCIYWDWFFFPQKLTLVWYLFDSLSIFFNLAWQTIILAYQNHSSNV